MPPGPPRRVRDDRFAALAAIVLAGFLLVVLGLLRLQVVQHDELQRLAEQNRIRLDVLRAPRGAIRDRNGRLLADNQPSFDVIFRPMPAESTLPMNPSSIASGGRFARRKAPAIAMHTFR